jgi:hypothetical protein
MLAVRPRTLAHPGYERSRLVNIWMSLLRQHLPQWLAKESASAWIMTGTLTCAGVAAAALSATPAQPLRVTNAIVQPIPLAPSMPAAPTWPCRSITMANGQSICSFHGWMGRHHHWGGGWWRHGNQPAPAATPYAISAIGTVDADTH